LKKEFFFLNFQKNKIIYGFIFFINIYKKNQKPQPITSYFRLPSFTTHRRSYVSNPLSPTFTILLCIVVVCLTLVQKVCLVPSKKGLYSVKVFYGLGSEAKEALVSPT